MSGQHRLALRNYRRSSALATKLGLKLDTAKIDRALSDVLMYLGRHEDAESLCRNSIRTFRRLGSKGDAAQSEVNLANLLHRQDRHQDAARIYERALNYFEKAGPELAYARVCYNLGNVLVQMFDWDRARAMFRQAESTYGQHEFELDANDARYGRAYIELLADRFATALEELTECERVYHQNGDPRGRALCHLDMAEAYLGLNLHDEALLSTRNAQALFAKLKLRYEHAKATLYEAYALAGLKSPADARRAARSAKRAFEKDRNEGMAAAAHLLIAQLAATPASRRKGLIETRKLFRRSQLLSWSTVCDLQLLAEPAAPRHLSGQLKSNPAVRRVPHFSALYDSIVGEREFKAGKMASARRHWQNATATLERVRATLPPIELRSAYLSGRHDPYRRLIALEAHTDAASAAAWAERLKTAGLWSLDPATFQQDPQAQRLLEEWFELSRRLSALARDLPSGSSTQRSRMAASAERKMHALERESRKKLTQIESRTLKPVEDERQLTAELLALSKRLPVVLWHNSGNDLMAFVLQDGEARSHIWPQGSERIQLEMQRWRFFMERQMLAENSASAHATDRAEVKFWDELGEWLWQPLDIDHQSKPNLLIIPEQHLFALPFAAIRCDDQWLGEQTGVIVAPSVRHYLSARSIVAPKEGVEILDAGGEQLAAVRHEVDTLVQLLGHQSCHLHRPADRQTMLNLETSRLWHFAGHARFRADNPFYSSLQLSDAPVFAADLRTRRVPVGLTTLSACHSGGGTSAPGEEYSGLVRSILEMGSRSVIAAMWPVSDKSTAHWMSTFYTRWLRGEPLSQAMHAAQVDTRDRWPSAYHWSAFTLFGSES
jgi:CHAT domain-containing protein